MVKKMENTVFESKHNIIGRGLVYVVDTRKNSDIKYSLNDIIMFENKKFIIGGIEKSGDGYWTNPLIGILVRNIDELYLLKFIYGYAIDEWNPGNPTRKILDDYYQVIKEKLEGENHVKT